MSATTLTATIGGTPVELPSGQILPASITVDSANSTFTVGTAGRYRTAYAVNSTLAVGLKTQIALNGAVNTAYIVHPLPIQL